MCVVSKENRTGPTAGPFAGVMNYTGLNFIHSQRENILLQYMVYQKRLHCYVSLYISFCLVSDYASNSSSRYDHTDH